MTTRRPDRPLQGPIDEPWRAIADELDIWQAEGRTATFWLRDDDAHAETAALGRLRDLAAHYDVPIALAVVPDGLDPAKAAIPRPGDRGSVLLHGKAHQNHALADAKKSEFPASRPLASRLDDIAAGWKRLSDHYPNALPVFVPPWNRHASDLLPHLPDLGLTGISTFRPRTTRHPVPGLVQANSHVDIIDWRGSRSAQTRAVVVSAAASHLAARRTNQADPDEPTGVLTHHLDHDDACWQLLTELFELTAGHAAVRWLAADDVFELSSISGS